MTTVFRGLVEADTPDTDGRRVFRGLWVGRLNLAAEDSRQIFRSLVSLWDWTALLAALAVEESLSLSCCVDFRCSSIDSSVESGS